MEVERSVVYYDKKTDHYLGEIPIGIEIQKLKQIFKPKKNDPLLYDPYKIGQKQKIALNKLITIDLDLDAYDYFLECFQKK
jgi:hypothetical protein